MKSSRTKETLEAWSSSLLSGCSVLHFFTTRKGGVSLPPFDSLNLGLTTKDKFENVLENRRRVEQNYPVKLSALSWQVHGSNVLVFKKGDPLPHEPDLPNGDAVVGNIPGLTIAMFFADCLPIYLWDPVHGSGGLAHAGWRSTVGDIAGRTVDCLVREFGSDPSDLLAALGPSIGPCCFEVKSDVENFFLEKFGQTVVEKRIGKTFVNLWEANRLALVKKGVKEEKIELAGKCTACSPHLYFSYRRDSGETGRMAGAIKIS